MRSRSVPNIHDATGSDDGTRPSPVINAQDYENSNAVVPLQIDDPDTTVPSIDNSHDAARPQKATLNDGRSSMKFKVATERDEMTLSMQRSHSRQDSDQYSETETIVPRRNLTVLDVASLIFNKMVGTTAPHIFSSADNCFVGWHRDLHDAGSCSWLYALKACEPGIMACWRCLYASIVRQGHSLTGQEQAH